jgi:hypothetical protein
VNVWVMKSPAADLPTSPIDWEGSGDYEPVHPK